MNVASLDLNLLTAFEALAREQNVSRAAADVGITQPAMSNALARLRVLFNDPLLVRAGRMMVLTARAQEAEEPIRQALNLVRRTLSEREKTSISSLSRTFTIGATEYVEHLLLPKLVKRVERAGPNVRLIVERLPTLFEVPESELRRGLLDLAIGFFDEGLSLGPGLSSELLFRDRHVCVLRKGHPQERVPLTLKLFQSLGHVAVFYRSDHSSVLDHMLRQRGIERRAVLKVPHMLSALAVVSATDLVCALPRRIAMAFARSMRLQCVPLPLELPAAKCTVGWHVRRDQDEALAWLRNEIRMTVYQLRHRKSDRRNFHAPRMS
ncbi:MAG: LysR family transcriptional regulator [Acidobacteriaceae bacterium]|nr:LysR family transcriptional regulator [Acidobacteriaceae bacterium]